MEMIVRGIKDGGLSRATHKRLKMPSGLFPSAPFIGAISYGGQIYRGEV